MSSQGWGCGYRTLQTVCSWIRNQQNQQHGRSKDIHTVPTILEIQQALVTMGDKTDSFNGSREWIGSVEVAMVADHMFDVHLTLFYHFPIDICPTFQ